MNEKMVETIRKAYKISQTIAEQTGLIANIKKIEIDFFTIELPTFYLTIDRLQKILKIDSHLSSISIYNNTKILLSYELDEQPE
jgi:hypothetical protein